MSRKPEKSRREGHRRSPRICALDAWKMAQRSRRVDSTPPSTCTEEMERDLGSVQGPASRTRARKKIKLRPVEELASTSLSSRPQLGGRKFSYEDHQTDTDQQDVWQWDKNSPKCKKQATYTDQPSTTPSAMWLPEKRLLELILDILQRRDTHEIFAEPVDPEEVEDYYKIIEEPMDFGTMRAKLHEGMYSNLEQFEHDVFLISRNAMHFNSSGTIYFRQARAISELANKVFQVLKTHPENFEMELLEIRRRSGRRPQNEAKNSFSSTCPKIGANMNSSRIMIEESSKLMPRSRSNSNIRRRFQVNQVCSDFFTGIDATEHEMLAGSSDGRRSRSIEEDRRDTYKPWGSFLSEDESIFATISGHSKQLEYVSQQDIGYRESLMLFVKDLEPTAQMVAKQKLLRGFQERKSLFSMKSTNTQWGPSILDTVNTVPISQNFLDNIPEHPTVTENTIDGVDWRDADKGEKAYMGSKMVSRFATVEMKSDSEIKKAHSTTGGKVHTSNDITNQVVFFGEKFHQNQTNDAPLCSYSLLDRGKGFNCSIAGCKGTGNNSTMILDQSKLYNQAQILELPFDTSHSNLSEVKLKNLGLSSFHYGKVSNKLSSAPGQNHGVSSSSEVTQALISDRSKPPTSQFIFDLPYLKARLGQINFSGRDRLLEQGSGTEVPFFNGMSNPRDSTCTHQVELNTLQPYRDDQPQSSSLDAHHRDLALQL